MGEYWHRQHGPWAFLLYAVSAVILTVGVTIQVPAMAYVFLPLGTMVFILAAGMQYLTVADGGDELIIQFGPLPIFRRRIRYVDIEIAELGRTIFLDGWGIHLSLRGGWVWNIWGYDCIVLKLRRGRFRIGTDDAENLLNLIRSKTKPMETR
jgi:hypothetical protein